MGARRQPWRAIRRLAGALVRRPLIEGRPPADTGARPPVSVLNVGHRYFDVVDTALMQGRMFTAADVRTGGGAGVVNQQLANPPGGRVRHRPAHPSRSCANSNRPWPEEDARLVDRHRCCRKCGRQRGASQIRRIESRLRPVPIDLLPAMTSLPGPIPISPPRSGSFGIRSVRPGP